MYIFWQSNPPHVNSLGFTQKCKKHTFLTGARSLSFFFLPMSTLPIAWSTAYGCFWYTHWHGFGMQNHVEVSFCIHESWFMNHKRRKTKEKKSTSVFDSESMNVEVMLPGRMVRRRTTQRAFRHRYGIYIYGAGRWHCVNYYRYISQAFEYHIFTFTISFILPTKILLLLLLLYRCWQYIGIYKF